MMALTPGPAAFRFFRRGRPRLSFIGGCPFKVQKREKS
jgi:hypothetical protein